MRADLAGGAGGRSSTEARRCSTCCAGAQPRRRCLGEGGLILLVDADVLVDQGWIEAVRRQPDAQAPFWRPSFGVAQLGGTLIVGRADLDAIGGYDEVFEGWGSEDVDIAARGWSGAGPPRDRLPR